MNNYSIVINGESSPGALMTNSVLVTPAATINNRREVIRNPTVRALNWDELFEHFQRVVQINKPATYTETIRSNPVLNKEYIKAIGHKVENYNTFGMEHIQENMVEQGVKKNFERYADGSADELLQPMTNVINIGALHNTWIMSNPRDQTNTVKIATTASKRDDYIKLGYIVLNHEVDSIETIGKHTIYSTSLTEVRQEGIRIRRETWTYTTQIELATIVEKGTEVFLPALDWDLTIHSKNCKDNVGCSFSKDNYYLMLQHYCAIHLPQVQQVHPNMPWKVFGRNEAVKHKPKEFTYLEWARKLAVDNPLCDVPDPLP